MAELAVVNKFLKTGELPKNIDIYVEKGVFIYNAITLQYELAPTYKSISTTSSDTGTHKLSNFVRKNANKIILEFAKNREKLPVNQKFWIKFAEVLFKQMEKDPKGSLLSKASINAGYKVFSNLMNYKFRDLDKETQLKVLSTNYVDSAEKFLTFLNKSIREYGSYKFKQLIPFKTSTGEQYTIVRLHEGKIVAKNSTSNDEEVIVQYHEIPLEVKELILELLLKNKQ